MTLILGILIGIVVGFWVGNRVKAWMGADAHWRSATHVSQGEDDAHYWIRVCEPRIFPGRIWLRFTAEQIAHASEAAESNAIDAPDAGTNNPGDTEQ